MTKGWEKDKEWSDRFIPEIRRALGEAFFSMASLADDQLRNTDLICLDLSGKRIGCRIRKKEYLYQYPFEFTIRSSRPGGTKTELQKIIEGWGDYFFYGFANCTEVTLLQWIIGDLAIFRSLQPKGDQQINLDGSSGFKSFKWSDMPKDFFVKISAVELLLSDVCEVCYFPKEIYDNNPLLRICPNCDRLYDYRLHYELHENARLDIY